MLAVGVVAMTGFGLLGSTGSSLKPRSAQSKSPAGPLPRQ
jgi:hypothetical protein